MFVPLALRLRPLGRARTSGPDEQSRTMTLCQDGKPERQPAMTEVEREAVREAGAEDLRRSRIEQGFRERFEDQAAAAVLAAISGTTQRCRGKSGTTQRCRGKQPETWTQTSGKPATLAAETFARGRLRCELLRVASIG
jgi:hypothetical protein